MDEVERIDTVKSHLHERVQGCRQALDEMIICLLTGGHMLLEGPPGVGKTHIAKTIASLIGATFSRIQGTEDLTPQDICGSASYEMESKVLHFRRGPIFSNIVLVDEINRAPQKTQSAFLQAMGESSVSAAGETHPLPEPFFVVATQNPTGYAGTNPLPEAQKDRFMMKTRIGYLGREDEKKLITSRREKHEMNHVIGCGEILDIKERIMEVTVADDVTERILDIIAATRERQETLQGASARAGIDYFQAVSARAFMMGREHATPQDAYALALPILRHRIVMNQDSISFGYTEDDLISDIIRRMKD
jgi:MoxR-like ATPase